MIRTKDERIRLAEARVVRAAVRSYKLWHSVVAVAWTAEKWAEHGGAVRAEERAVRALLKLREGERK
jgi:hypothetical protein